MLHELRHPHYHPMEAQQRGRAGVQRLRIVLQITRGQQAIGHAEGWHTDEEAETEEDPGAEREVVHRGPRDQHLDHFLSLHGLVYDTLIFAVRKYDNETAKRVIRHKSLD